jgi:hypothetical protein
MGCACHAAMLPAFLPGRAVGLLLSHGHFEPKNYLCSKKKEHENKYAPFAKSRTPTLKVRFVVEYEYGVLQDKRESKFWCVLASPCTSCTDPSICNQWSLNKCDSFFIHLLTGDRLPAELRKHIGIHRSLNKTTLLLKVSSGLGFLFFKTRLRTFESLIASESDVLPRPTLVSES